MPISRVRSSTATFMMFETPMPPTTSVREPTMPRNSLKASMKVSKKLGHLGGVPDTQRLLVLRVEAVLAGDDSQDLVRRLLRCA